MKESEIIAKIQAGQIFVFAEYRGHKIDKKSWRDKKTGNMVDNPVISHAVEFDNGAKRLEVMEWAPKDLPAGAVLKSNFVKGQRVAVELTGLEQEGYGSAYTGSGVIHLIDVK